MTQRYRNVHRDPRVLIKMMEEISDILPVHVTHEDVIRMVLLFVSMGTWDTFVRMHIPDGDCWENAKHERVCNQTANCKMWRNFCDG